MVSKRPIALTARDLEMLAAVGAYGCAPLDVLSMRFFAAAWDAGSAPRNPDRACERRVLELARAGLLTTRIVKGTEPGRTTRLVALTTAGAKHLAPSRNAHFPTRFRVHHMQTLRVVEALRRELADEGQVVARVLLERDQRRQAHGGRATRRGDEYECFADAVVVVDMSAHGDSNGYQVAVEYVTSKYASSDILEKAESFRRFDRVVFVADNVRTAARVTRLTGEPCRCL